ncbi:uncharacterized protein SOCEGT47_062720 [Sorangium cellulosum]|uniref:DUF2169 domain-containing protein n=1 Tax=Sorangium cellulosum TaxID=56 RepID=A0A4P2Q9G0_SORCE|nr:DUF2169 domain-containing protein [Sorangium cellulosum]AUX25723.1 uncharacterized protein SOCEGT47_062720 [Sorangium cellulosum]
MKIVNPTPTTFAAVPWQLRPPQWALCLIAKGTYRLVPGAPAIPADAPEPPLGDVHEGDDPRGALRHASDFAPFKPRADLLLTGKAHAPGRRPVTSLPVSFAVGKTSLALQVTGDRYWADPATGQRTDPQPFVEMPLGYGRAFGGPGFAANPVGRGVFDPGEREVRRRPLPNIEDPRAPVDSPAARPPPAGFGPLAASWALRAGKLGTYDARWLKQRWPFFPEDLDWSYFNAAPPALQAEHLRGDEEIVCHNLHRERRAYRARLPGVRIRCFLDELAGGADRFREVPMHLDTAHVDLEAERLVLVWRGHAPVSAEDHPEVRHVLVASEPLGEGRLAAAHYRERLALALLGERPAAADARAPAAAGPAAAPPGNDNDGAPPLSGVDDAELLAQIRAALEKGRAPAAVVSSLGTPEGDAALEAWLGELGGDPARLDEIQRKTRAQMEEALEAQGHDPAQLDALDREDGAQGRAAEGPAAPWTRERVELCLSIQESMAGADLSGLDLSGLDLGEARLARALLVGADLTGARLAGADLEGATLARAAMAGARLPSARLSDADLSGADLTGADLAGAALGGARLDGAALRGAVLTGAGAAGASFVEADLTDARLDGAALAGARLARAALDRASFRGAALEDASLEGAHGEAVDLRGADLRRLRASERTRLPRARARGARADGARFQQADLTGADLALSSLRRADLGRADLGGADLRGADLAGADLTRARLAGARLERANLHGARLEAADLDGADLRGAELHEAALWQARLEGADLRGAHLSSTLLTSDRGAT